MFKEKIFIQLTLLISLIGSISICNQSCLAQPQLTTQDFEKPFFYLKRQGTTTSPKEVTLLVIGFQPKNKGEPIITKKGLNDLFFNSNNSVAHWFQENSQGRYKIMPHPTNSVLGPYVSDRDWEFYWRVGAYDPDSLKYNDPHRYVDGNGKVNYRDDNGFIDGFRNSWAEVIRKASKEIDFSVFDLDGNKDLSPDECIVVIVKAQAKNAGFRRPTSGSDVPKTDLVVNGVTIKEISEVYTGPPYDSADIAVAVEEVLHRAANLADQYPDPIENYPEGFHRRIDDSRRPGQFSLTDAGQRPVHTDPFHKLKWGWLNPQIANHSGKYILRDAATTGDALILYNPYMGIKEFFILENRWRGNSYDRFREDNRGEGLALWHCIQDNNLNDWGRTALHLRRADPLLDIQKGHENRYKFKFIPTGDGYMYIQHKYSGKFLCSGEITNGAIIKIWGPIPSGHEDRYKFKIIPKSENESLIEHKYSKKYFTLKESINGKKIQLFGPNAQEGKDQCNFKIIPDGDGYSYIFQQSSNKYVCSGATTNGSDIFVWGPKIKWEKSLFNAKNVNSVVNDDSYPQNLHFSNGLPSRISISNFSQAGEIMTVDVNVPPKIGSINESIGKIKMIRIHGKNSMYGPVNFQIKEDVVVKIESEPGGIFGIDLNTSEGIEMYNLIREAFESDNPVTIHYKAYAYGGKIIRVISNK